MTFNELIETLKYEDKNLKSVGNYPTLSNKLLREHKALFRSYVRLLRFDEYFSQGTVIHRLISVFIKYKRHNLGAKLNIYIPNYTCKRGLVIWHYGCVVNGDAHIGENCQFHGFNCVGNKGVIDERAPSLGDNIDIGTGAKIIGPIMLENNIRIGANAVVTKSCCKEGVTLVGVPAKETSKEHIL